MNHSANAVAKIKAHARSEEGLGREPTDEEVERFGRLLIGMADALIEQIQLDRVARGERRLTADRAGNGRRPATLRRRKAGRK